MPGSRRMYSASTERFSPVGRSVVGRNLFSALTSLQETNRKSLFYLACVAWSHPVGSLIA